MKRVVSCALKLVFAFIMIVNFASVLPRFTQMEVYACSTNSPKVVAAFPSIKDILKSIFNIKEKPQQNDRQLSVYVGGQALGFTLECEGVMVVAIGEVDTIDGSRRPAENKNIKIGDIISHINNQKITSAANFSQLLNDFGGREVQLTIVRSGQEFSERVTPALDLLSNTYRLGLWIRDNAAGVGTLTYVREDNMRFGALGHPVTDIDTGKTMPIMGGNIYKCSIVGINKGSKGNPGELRGLFLKTGEEAGKLDLNNDYGVYGTIKESYVKNNNLKKMQVGFRDKVKTGKAKILCTVDGDQPREFDIEIVKLSYQSSSNKKSMVLKVVDPELISKTGGIVQGMSGSPIIQDGKLVGAVTHVFVSDPTKGFGVYIDWMIDN